LLSLLLLLLLVIVVDDLKSQLSAERKHNTEMKQLNDSLFTSQEQANMQLAFYEEERGCLHRFNRILHIVIHLVP